MLSPPVSLPRPRHIEAGPLTCGDYRRHPGEPPALTFHYIFHYISHPFSWWQLVPWLLRRGDALRRAHLISSHTRTGTHLNACAHTVTHTNTHWIHCCLRWLTPDYRFLFTSRKVTGQAGVAAGGLWQLWHPILICCYQVSGMRPCLHPSQIWLVEWINMFQCYKQLGCNIARPKPNVKSSVSPLCTPFIIQPGLPCRYNFKPGLFCFLVKVVMLSTPLDPDRAMSLACRLAP